MGAKMDTSITIRTDKELSDKISALASSIDRSRNWVIENAIREYLDNQLWQVEGIQAAIQSMDAGKGISHAHVMKEMDSFLLGQKE
jgi:predicted transcriptional regulator